jgi:NitT/TauT family transport system ATP-binding protein
MTLPADTRPLVTATEVTKTYETRDGPVLALDHVSFDVPTGQFLSIVGPSGCGKSTLMLLAAGLLPASSGTITIDGVTIQRPYTNLGIVFQDAVLLDWRRVLDNLLLQIEVRHLDKRAYRERALQLLETVGLTGFEQKYPYELSGGMRQRVSICRALVHDPPLLLMDEPFGAVDAITRDQLNLDLQHIWLQTQKTVIFITHSISEAVFLSDRVMVMSPRPGRIEAMVDIDLPRPRTFAMRDAPEFAAYARQIRRIFEATGIIRDVEEPRSTSVVD